MSIPGAFDPGGTGTSSKNFIVEAVRQGCAAAAQVPVVMVNAPGDRPGRYPVGVRVDGLNGV